MQDNATLEPIMGSNYDAMVKAYGVWDRSSYDKDPFLKDLREEKFLKGLRISPRWADLEPKRGEYKWRIIDKAAEKAAKEGKYFYFQLLVGPDSPDWIYRKGVPLVKIEAKKEGKEKKEELNWPYYPDEEGKYVEYLTTTIAAIADHIFKRWSNKELERLLFIQVATGSTGDEAPYKGEAKRNKYKLDDKDPKWNEYRRKIFQAYADEFQKPKRKKSIPLLFNKIDKEDYPVEYEWANNNVDYLGRKGSVLPRGYHLTEMREFIDKFRPYPLDPKKHFILTRAEMDQTWKRDYFQLNLPMNLYWAMLNALHGGLCVWDVSEDILDPIDNEYLDQDQYKNEIIPIFKFFNKYAGELLPESAKGAFIAFRKGLDSSHMEAYPEAQYPGIGEINKKNTERYKQICQKYEQFGARMGDPDGAALGQVEQRKKLTDFNDSGWQIPRGNYERFITQINQHHPDYTEKNHVALWRIDWPQDDSEPKDKLPKYSRFARGLRRKGDRIDLRVDKKFYSVKEGEKPTKIKIKLIYLDKGQGSFSILYDSIEGSEKVAYTVQKNHPGECGKWKHLVDEKGEEIIIDDAAFNNHDNIPDISLVNNDDEDSIFHMLEIEKMN